MVYVSLSTENHNHGDWRCRGISVSIACLQYLGFFFIDVLHEYCAFKNYRFNLRLIVYQVGYVVFSSFLVHSSSVIEIRTCISLTMDSLQCFFSTHWYWYRYPFSWEKWYQHRTNREFATIVFAIYILNQMNKKQWA
jgi:hypothetical protein